MSSLDAWNTFSTTRHPPLQPTPTPPPESTIMLNMPFTPHTSHPVLTWQYWCLPILVFAPDLTISEVLVCLLRGDSSWSEVCSRTDSDSASLSLSLSSIQTCQTPHQLSHSWACPACPTPPVMRTSSTLTSAIRQDGEVLPIFSKL